ncbi:substrate-binding domain-containing protein [Akkermansia glycaniphila]|uniref:Transcription regulator hth gntr n=1 Tax=Akkermansia glycaniphila TaxID=1679444 RepID=A0A1H6LA63_9BACT|nr:substrate-binding domain-containing protein [Akkermansia glycaniphila]MBT9449277.1 substrate-binding domain-containing protein [Akkermansia glycaniphila]SEH85147.1 transcription regulator hth gntr [Akkermansia glycaniphila]
MNQRQHPLAISIAGKLRQAFRAGRFEGILPGERELVAIYNVGRETIRSALLQLEQEGLITAPIARSPRRILLSPSLQEAIAPPRPTEKQASIGFLSSVPIGRMPQGILAELHYIRNLFEQNGLDFHIHEMPWSIGNTPENRLARLEAKNNHDCWILYHASCETQNWFKKRHIPCIVRGTSYPTSKLPCLDTNWGATANHAANHLWHKGHRNIGLCMPEEKLRGHQLVKKHFFDFEAEGWNPVIIPFPADIASTFENLERACSENKEITAFVTMRGNQIVTLLSWTATHAISIPAQISLVSLSYEPILTHLYPPIANYEINAEKSVRRLVRMISHLLASKNTSSAFVLPEFNPGQSVAARH